MANTLKFSMVMEAVTTAFNTSVRQAGNTYTNFTAGVRRDSEATARAGQTAGASLTSALNLRPNTTIRQELAKINADLASFRANAGAPAAEVNRITAAANARIAELKNELRGVGTTAQTSAGGVSILGARLLAAAGVTVGLAGVNAGLKAIMDTTIQLEQVMKQLEFGTGSAEQAAIEYEFLRKTAQELGLDLQTLGRDYAQLTAATKGTNLEGEATRTLFTGIASAAATLGLSAENTSGVITALSQIASKGKVSMEELRQQLGERLPGAFSLAARSMGVTTGELEKLVANGLDATVFLKAFGPALVETFGGQAADNVNKLQGKINLLRNEFNELLLDLSKGGVGDGLKAVFETLTDGIAKVRAAMTSMDPATIQAVESAFTQLFNAVTATVGGVFSALMDVVAGFEAWADTGVGLVSAFAGLPTVTDDVSFLTRTLQGVSVALGALNDGVAGIGIMFTALTGSVQTFFSVITRGLAAVTFGDLSRELGELADRLGIDAAKSFDKANQAALNFKSQAVAALDATVSSGKAAGDAIADGVGSGTAKATAAVSGLGQAAVTAAKTIELSAGVGGEAVLGIAKSGNEAADAIKALAETAGVQLPLTARTAQQLGTALAEVASKSKAVATVIATELPEVLSKLNGTQLAEFQVAFVGGMQEAGASVETLSQTTAAFATAAAKNLGADLTAAIGGLSVEFVNLSANVDVIINSMAKLGGTGADTSKALVAALDAMLAKARNPAEVTALIAEWKRLGAEGKIAGDAMVDGINRAKAKIDELTPGVNSVAEAFKKFGIQTQAELSKVAKEFEGAFFKLEASGQASAEGLRTAFTQMAQAAIAANDGVASEWIKSKAAVLGLQVTVDETGKSIVSAMSSGAAATSTTGQAAEGAAKGYDKLAKSVDTATTALERQNAAAERANAAAEKAVELENKRRGVDSSGFAADAKGDRIVAGGDVNTLTGVANFLKNAGLDDAMAKQIALEFSDGKGNIAYTDNIGMKKYGDKYDTISAALLKAAETITFGAGVTSSAVGVGAPAMSKAGRSSGAAYDSAEGGGVKQIIEFKDQAGNSATMTGKGSDSAEQFMKIVKNAGASASIASR